MDIFIFYCYLEYILDVELCKDDIISIFTISLSVTIGGKRTISPWKNHNARRDSEMAKLSWFNTNVTPP